MTVPPPGIDIIAKPGFAISPSATTRKSPWAEAASQTERRSSP